MACRHLCVDFLLWRHWGTAASSAAWSAWKRPVLIKRIYFTTLCMSRLRCHEALGSACDYSWVKDHHSSGVVLSFWKGNAGKFLRAGVKLYNRAGLVFSSTSSKRGQRMEGGGLSGFRDRKGLDRSRSASCFGHYAYTSFQGRVEQDQTYLQLPSASKLNNKRHALFHPRSFRVMRYIPHFLIRPCLGPTW